MLSNFTNIQIKLSFSNDNANFEELIQSLDPGMILQK